MAKRYRYAFARRKEAKKGKLSVILAGASLALFPLAVILASILDERFQVISGSIALFAAMLSAYGFWTGLASFSETDRKHRASIIGSIASGILLVGWVGLYLAGLV